MKNLFDLIAEVETNPYDTIMVDEASIISPQTSYPMMNGTVEFASDYFPPSEQHSKLKSNCDKFGDIIYTHDDTKPYSLDELESLLATSKELTDYINALKGKAQNIPEPKNYTDIHTQET